MPNIWREHREEKPEKQLMMFNTIKNSSEILAEGAPSFLGSSTSNEDELSKCS